jgi:putative SOS response-associated peptidase YedK
MCGRYELSSHPDVVALAFGLAHAPALRARYNIAPTQAVPVVRVNRDGERECVEMRWGFIPRFAKDPAIGARMINARAETVAKSGAFRYAFAHHRCLVPLNGFYEWRKTATGKVPHHIGMRDGRPFALAGIYERWRAPDGEPVTSVAIVTTDASEAVRGIHDRMPVIVPPDAYARWLDRANEDASDVLAPWQGEALRIHPVSKRVNAVANDDASLIEPAAEASASSSAAPAAESNHEANARDRGREDEGQLALSLERPPAIKASTDRRR